jgi:hypothetical protein
LDILGWLADLSCDGRKQALCFGCCACYHHYHYNNYNNYNNNYYHYHYYNYDPSAGRGSPQGRGSAPQS